MLRKMMLVVIGLCTLSGCYKHKPLVGDHPPELVGKWELLVRSSCIDYGVKSDTLILHADGTFDQMVTTKDGKRIDATGQHWSYSEAGGSRDIALDRRLEFFTPEHFHTRIGEGVSTFEVLLVEYKSEPVILLHPDSDCVYTKVR